MTSKHVIAFHAIAKLFEGTERQLKRGETAFGDGHVLEMNFARNVKPAVLTGVVQASQRKNVKYKVEIEYDEERGIEAGRTKCTCALGQGVCHHMAALLLYAHYNISSTDIECRWKAPAHKKDEDLVKPLEEMFPLKEQYISLKTELISDEQIQDFRRKLGETSVVGFSWLLKPEIPRETLELIPSIEDILYSTEYSQTDNREKVFTDKCSLTEEEIKKIERATIGQHENESWLVCRKMRLTASKFGLVLNACLRNSYPPSLFKNLLDGYNLERARVIQWGKEHEKTALEKFIEVMGFEQNDVAKSGLWLHRCGYLGASPDGLIGNESILEIKCPYKYRNGSLKSGIQIKKDYFYFYNEDNQAVISTTHPYYHQIQGQLYVTGRQQCYFFVWTPTENECLLIEKDPEWESNIELLKNFYLTRFIPYILNGTCDKKKIM